VPAALVRTLAIHNHRGRVDEPPYSSGRRRPQHDCGTEIVGPDVIVHVIEINTKTDLGRQVNYGLAALHRGTDSVEVGDLVARIQGPVEDHRISARSAQCSGSWPADEASSASQQHFHG
jgi:hypothetical protein